MDFSFEFVSTGNGNGAKKKKWESVFRFSVVVVENFSLASHNKFACQEEVSKMTFVAGMEMNKAGCHKKVSFYNNNNNCNWHPHCKEFQEYR